MPFLPIVRLGDTTTHGGHVLEGFQSFRIEGIPVAGLGHMTHCPTCRGDFPIVESVTTDTVDGVGISVEGMRTACGARLIASQKTDFIEVIETRHGRQDPSDVTACLGKSPEHGGYGRRFRAVDSETGMPLGHRQYLADIAGTSRQGTSDSDGFIDIDAAAGALIRLHIVFNAPTGPLKPEGV